MASAFVGIVGREIVDRSATWVEADGVEAIGRNYGKTGCLEEAPGECVRVANDWIYVIKWFMSGKEICRVFEGYWEQCHRDIGAAHGASDNTSHRKSEPAGQSAVRTSRSGRLT
eukprot:GFKZ01005623.1.p2 GENE.GFKZ01005623.1~~GFKZ01005623.1.p2  ORF type:complete len:114 (-),score=3.83 GFKZ01005623.1:200-541(-)